MASVGVVFEPLGSIAMVVKPDTDKQLDDPSFNPKGWTQVRITKASYDVCLVEADTDNACLPALDVANPTLATVVRAKLSPVSTVVVV